MYARTFTIAAITFLSLAQFTIAGDYRITSKSTLPEGATNRCNIKINGTSTVGQSTTLKKWDGVSFPLYAFIPADFNKKISYSPISGCTRLEVDIACHSKPEGSEWRQKLAISPCQDRTVNVSVNGARLE